MGEGRTEIERVYAMSDLHGHLPCLQAALELVDLEGDSGAQLVLLGDYIDRGPQSAEVLYAVRHLHQRFPERVVVLRGNHEDWFLDWFDAQDHDLSWLMTDIDLVTVKSFLEPLELAQALGHQDPTSDASALDGPTMNRRIKQAIRGRHAGLLDWLHALPRCYETDAQIFVHAGVNEDAGDLWKAATPERMFTEKFPPTFGSFVKTIIAGHVATASIHPDGSHGVFFDGESHYYIDGSAEYTGRANLLRYSIAEGTYQANVVDPETSGSG
ncbi:metallophosphoesterase [Nesterenkonia sp.]|uniref:metallophosphoesterase n=1 Tax=Nesterenkonia sp. TaxID=704201 RepID=UPI00262942BE|nr:metallophosphoesterase [Nesterenkonia sp.]